MSQLPQNNNTHCKKDKAIKEIKLMRSKRGSHSSKNMQKINNSKTKIQQQKKDGHKMTRKSQEIRRENVAKFSQSSLHGIIFNIYCTIIEDDSGCLMV